VIKARQKGVRKANEIKIKARETSGTLRAHRMNWKVRFWELTGWRPKNNEERTKNDEERWKTFVKSPTETSRKCYGSASAWIYFKKTIFLTNFKWISDTRRVERICSSLLPLFIGEKREVVAAQLAQASWVASTKRHRFLLEHPGRPKWAWFLFAHPYLLNTPPFCLFCWIFFRNVTELCELRNDTCFPSVMLRNFTDYATTPFLTSGMLRNFTDCATMLPFDFWHVAELHGLPNDGC